MLCVALLTLGLLASLAWALQAGAVLPFAWTLLGFALYLVLLRGLRRSVTGHLSAEQRAMRQAEDAASALRERQLPLPAGDRLLRLRCPQCGQRAMGFARKFALSWLQASVPCAACAAPLEVDRLRGMAVSLPLLLGLPVLSACLALGLLRSPALAVAVVLALLWATVAAWCCGVGLRVRGRYG